MTDRPLHVLILCTGNSARSILAEDLINEKGAGRVVAHSAGSFPKGEVHPHALVLLKRLGRPTGAFRSKSWDEFAASGAPQLDFVITVCDNAAGEVCPIWPGGPLKAHWGVPDPAAVTGAEREVAAAFAETYERLAKRIDAFIALPLENLDHAALKASLDRIGKLDDGAVQ